jgi:hypothetical protein
MRRIESQTEREARQKTRVRIIGIILLGLMVLSSIGYAFLYYQDYNEGGGSRSTNQTQQQTMDGRWILEVQGQQLVFATSKESVKNISINTFLSLNNLAGKPLYISVENNSAVFYELSYNLQRFVGKSPVEACFGSCEEDLPEKNCTAGENLIIYRKAENNQVYQNDSCIFIEGDIRAVDAFLYSLFNPI